MSVLIKNMEIPEHCGYCRFRYDGICHALQKTQYSVEECPLVSVNDTNTAQRDTVKVVRCKDCKHHDGEKPGRVYCPDIIEGWISEYFFCAGGERREGENDGLGRYDPAKAGTPG